MDATGGLAIRNGSIAIRRGFEMGFLRLTRLRAKDSRTGKTCYSLKKQ